MDDILIVNPKILLDTFTEVTSSKTLLRLNISGQQSEAFHRLFS
jgi:hypothetical protein